MTFLPVPWQHPFAGTSHSRRRTSFIPASADAARTPRASLQSAHGIRRQPPVPDHQRLSASAILGKPSPSNAAAAPNPHRQSSAHPIPRVRSSEAFGRRPFTGSTSRARAAIRNPYRKTTSAVNWSFCSAATQTPFPAIADRGRGRGSGVTATACSKRVQRRWVDYPVTGMPGDLTIVFVGHEDEQVLRRGGHRRSLPDTGLIVQASPGSWSE